MYKHILIPTDGSPLSEDAVKQGLTLAKALDAQVTVLTATIVETAKTRGCDLIVMASHGRKGLSALVLGSETTKVLAHSKIPTLVCR